jgi:hypothetical protein
MATPTTASSQGTLMKSMDATAGALDSEELAEGRPCQVFAVYSQKQDMTAPLQWSLGNEGSYTALLRASVDTPKRKAW